MNQIPENAQPIGYRWLVEQFNLTVIPHYRWSYIIQVGARRVLQDRKPLVYLYDRDYQPTNEPLTHLAFALKHEGFNLEIISATLPLIPLDAIEQYITAHPSGKYERIIWYLLEQLTPHVLDLPDLERGAYVDLLDGADYYTAKPLPQRRYRINDNLLGNLNFCPFVRKTKMLHEFDDQQFDLQARALLKPFSQQVIDRASNYLYAHETMSSYEIEHEQPSPQRLNRFIKLIKRTEAIAQLSKQTLVQLQNTVVDPRFSSSGYRNVQNYVGEQRDWYRHILHYISPQPKDVEALMAGLLEALEYMIAAKVNPIAIATTIAFGFVFIHPFDDGNGRIHRFLIHYVLSRTGFAPKGLTFPISAIMLADQSQYDAALEYFSRPLTEAITHYHLDEKGALTIEGETASLYRYIDYTPQAEYLASCIEKTIKTDFKNELTFIINFDKAKKELNNLIDMPGALIDIFITQVVRNQGKLSNNKRKSHFPMLTDKEIAQMESVVQRIMALTSKA